MRQSCREVGPVVPRNPWRSVSCRQSCGDSCVTGCGRQAGVKMRSFFVALLTGGVLLAGCASAPGGNLVAGDGRLEAPTASEDTEPRDRFDDGSVGWCSTEARSARETEPASHFLLPADEIVYPAVWLVAEGALESAGTFEALALYDEVVLRSDDVAFFDNGSGERRAMPPRELTTAELLAAVPGSRVNAPFFASTRTAPRFERASVLGGTWILGLVWNDAVDAWGVISPWFETTGGAVIYVADCGEEMSAQFADMTATLYPEAKPRDVLLGAPVDEVSEYYYGPTNQVEAFDYENADVLAGGGIAVEIVVSGDLSDRTLCATQGADAVCTSLLVAEGETFTFGTEVNPAYELGFLLMPATEISVEGHRVLASTAPSAQLEVKVQGDDLVVSSR